MAEPADITVLERQLERERAARRELERSAERGLRRLYEKSEAADLLARIAQAANDAPSLEAAMRTTLEAMCNYTGWPAGHVYRYRPNQRQLIPTNWWHAPDGHYDALRAATAETQFGEGEGLPGRVWQSRRPAWIEDVTGKHDFVRKNLPEDLGVRAAFAFPILVGHEVPAVVEFFTPDVVPPNDEWLAIVETIGTLLGRVAERERARALLEAKNRELERSNHELQQFAYVASHDLQEPLRMVAGFLELLEHRYADSLDDTARKYIGFAVEGAKRMRTLINDLLRFSRVTTKAQPPEPVDLTALLTQVQQNVGMAIAESGAVIDVDPLPTVPADPSQLRQVFQNLIENAVKFRRPDTTPHIRVSAQDEGDVWAIALADNGVGIAEEHRERIFELFQRLNTREHFKGNGIGLTLVRKIVERHGGTVRVSDTPGGGTTFTVVLPKESPLGDTAPAFADSP